MSRFVSALTLLTLLAALTAAVTVNAQSPSAVSAVEIPPGQIDAAVAKLDGVVTDAMQRSGVPGVAVAVVKDDRVVYSKGFGVRRVGSTEPVDQNTVFQLASVSKPIGATAVARAVGQGIVDFDDPVVEHLPGFRLKSRNTTARATIADFYSHRSGLPDHGGDLLETLFGYSRSEVLRRLRYLPLAPLRNGYAYNNYGITAAGVAAARAAGLSWAEFSKRMLYSPLGMTSTSSRFADFVRRPNRAGLHMRVGDHWEPGLVRRPDGQSPAGGASSNVVDLAKWLRLYLGEGAFGGRQLVAPAAFARMRTPHSFLAPPVTAENRPSTSGLGIDISPDATARVKFTHSGAFISGTATNVTMLPSEKLGIVVLTNGQPVGVEVAIAAAFMDLAELGKVSRDWLALYRAVESSLYVNQSRLANRRLPAHPRPARRRSVYTGTYTNGFAGPVRVTTRRGRLTLLIGPRLRRAFPLTHWGGSTFSYLPTGEDSTGISAVTFRFRRGRRRAATVTLENLGAVGTLRRR